MIFKKRIKLSVRFIVAILILVSGIGACSYFMKHKKSEVYRIGYDSTWHPIPLDGKERAMMGFVSELFQEIAKVEELQIKLINTGADYLFYGLNNGDFDGVLSSLTVASSSKYLFSKPFYLLGPVLIVPFDSSIH